MGKFIPLPNYILSIGNLVAKQEVAEMNEADLQDAIRNNDSSILEKLRMYTKQIPGSAAYYRAKLQETHAYVEHVRVRSSDKKSFNVFLTLSMADFHWPQLHKQFPDSDKYLGKTVRNV